MHTSNTSNLRKLELPMPQFSNFEYVTGCLRIRQSFIEFMISNTGKLNKLDLLMFHFLNFKYATGFSPKQSFIEFIISNTGKSSKLELQCISF